MADSSMISYTSRTTPNTNTVLTTSTRCSMDTDDNENITVKLQTVFLLKKREKIITIFELFE